MAKSSGNSSSKIDDFRERLVGDHGTIKADSLLTEIAALAYAKDPLFKDKAKYTNCKRCRLCATRDTVVYGSGPSNADILVIGEAPGADEDSCGVPFSGRTGTFMRTVMAKVGIPVHQIYFTNAVACIPKDSKEARFRQPTPSEMQACSERLKFICDESPLKDRKITLLFGKPAYVGYNCRDNHDQMSNMMRTTRVKDIIGLNEEDMTYMMYHPSYIMRQNNSEVTQDWVNHFKKIKSLIEV